MKNLSIAKYIAFAALGLVLLVGGLVLTFVNADSTGVLRSLPFICVGVGAGLFGGNLGTAIKNSLLRRDKSYAKKVEIEEKDERNQAIGFKAKAKAYDMMVFIFGALMLAFALLQVDMYVILALVAAYLFVVGTHIYYVSKYSKEM